jgi:mannitol/fructose-specific phosphotransferase system IIA component (Ntr-type)
MKTPQKAPVSSYLSEKRILFLHAGPSKLQVLGSLIGALDLPDPGAALKAILAREESGSTIIYPGFAIPHARIDGIKRLQAAVGICDSGVIDPRAGGRPVHIFVLFVAPSDNMVEHLAFLASASALFQKKGFIEKLTKLASPAGILHVIRDAEKSL